MSRFLIFMILFTCTCFNSCGQQVFYQDVCNCGVTGAGYNPTWNSNAPGIIQLHIEPGSTIRKAFLLIGTYTNIVYPTLGQSSMQINGNTITLDSSIVVHNSFSMISGGGNPYNLQTGIVDITSYIDAAITTLNIVPPESYINGRYIEYYVLVAYENSTLPESNVVIVLNEQNSSGIMEYSISSINPIDTNAQVGFAIQSSHICNLPWDGSYVSINDETIGLIGGADENNPSASCGVTGSFYYQNHLLYGLSDDVADEAMLGSDAIANIQNYISNPTEIDIRFTYQALIDGGSGTPTSNAIWQLYFAYTTPCQPFETTLTEEVAICRGDSAQLLVSMGTEPVEVPAYEWQPQEDLSCYDCPNPVFLGDSTRHYTVRIWNTDSCSKVLPVKVLVHDVPTQANLNLNPATCSESNGSMNISNVVGGSPQYIFNIGGNSSTNPNFNYLAPGVYNLQITDANSCTYNQPFTIEEINPVTAAFSANPQQGVAPLNVNFTNQSTGANLYQWLVNTQTFESTNLNYTFDTAGTYPVQLIVTYNEPHCADTAQKVIVVENAFSAIIPTLHAASQGFWSIKTTNVTRAKVQIYNAIGQLLHQTEQAVSNGPNPIWNATGKATGYYLYRIKLTDVEGREHDYKGKVLVVN
jgi:PKD repeat protein